VSIAKAIVFFLVQNFKVPPKTLFATHYHELTKLEEEFPTKIHNFHMEIDEHNGHLTFLHTIAKGAADKSFGVAVAALAGVPKEVVEKANEFLSTFSESALITESSEANYLDKIDLDKTTPIEALNILKRIKENKRKK
jgi:DNA mismatch repair protein MutS